MNRNGIGKNHKQLTAAGYQDKMWETRNKKVPKMAKARSLFPIVSCLGGYWLCIGWVLGMYWLCYVIDVVGDDVVYVDAVYLIYLIGWVH